MDIQNDKTIICKACGEHIGKKDKTKYVAKYKSYIHTKCDPFGGRPTKYDPKYCDALIEFFNVEPTREGLKITTYKNGTTVEDEVEYPNSMPHFISFCDEIGIGITTFYRWVEKHKAFRASYERAKAYQERHLVDNALLNNYNSGFSSLVAKNWLGWKDRSDVTTDDEKIDGLQVYKPGNGKAADQEDKE